MVLLKVTDRITDAINKYKESDLEDGKSVEELKKSEREGYMQHGSIIYIYKQLKKHDDKFDLSLHDFLKGSTIDTERPKPKPRPKTKEFIELTKQLREKELEREYQDMVRSDNVPKSLFGGVEQDGDDLTPGAMVKEVKEQLATIVNVLVSVASVSWAIWYWTGSSMGATTGTRTLMSLFGGIVILVAEVVIYGRYKTKISDARKVEKSKKEKTTVVSSSTYHSSKSEKTNLKQRKPRKQKH